MLEQTFELPKPNKLNSYSEFSIGTLLIQAGKISTKDAEEVMSSLDSQSMRFGEVAIKLGLVTDEDIQEVLAKQFDYSRVIQSNHYFPSTDNVNKPSQTEVEFLCGLRSQLMLGWFKDKKNALAISSIDKLSGNSHLAANLSIAFSQLGKKTLLIDANLRNPTQHKIFAQEAKHRGLSDILIGRAGSEAIYSMDKINYLSVLFSGAVPPNPQELISGTLFVDLMKFLNEIYDVIIVDTPAFSECADAQMIASAVGGVLLVSRKNHTRVDKISNVSNLLTNNGTEVVGSIISSI